MADYNVKINVKTSTGYDTLYPKSKSDIIDFDKSGSDLSATETESAIKEVNTKSNTNKTNIGTLSSLTTDSKSNLVGAINEVDKHTDTNTSSIGTLSSLLTSVKTNLVSAINEIVNNFVKKSSIINNLLSTSTDAPLSANMGKELKEEIDKINNKFKYVEFKKTVTVDAKAWKGIDMGSITSNTPEGYEFFGVVSKSVGYGDNWAVTFGKYNDSCFGLVYNYFDAQLTSYISCNVIYIKI